MSNSQLPKLARLAAGRKGGPEAASTDDGVSSFAEKAGSEFHISVDEFRNTPSVAYAAVDVPDSVIDILVSVRNYLQVRGCTAGVGGGGAVNMADAPFITPTYFVSIWAQNNCASIYLLGLKLKTGLAFDPLSGPCSLTSYQALKPHLPVEG